MTPPRGRRSGREVWGGVECTVNRVGNQWFDQQVWSGHEGRFAFARAIALAWRLPTEDIVAARVDTCGPARRPANRALGTVRGNGMRPLDQPIAADAADAPWLPGIRTCASS